ncbi:MutS-related protein [Senegalia sp. (in: firmicutes)]|uniref:MutS-related protein n=1 Tax=Senegalia sp. (in: firmicutes) TaxID=1924098 RepID=UPI003F9B8145
MKAIDIYERRRKKFDDLSKRINKTMNIISTIRLITAVLILVLGIFLARDISDFVLLALFTISVGLFLYLVKLHNGLKKHYKYILSIRDINIKNIERLNWNWNKFKEDGSKYVDENHRFTYDLDIFGRNSLFQYINRTYTPIGKEKLANILKNPISDIEEIKERQEAIKELSYKRWWRQRFAASAIEEKKRGKKTKGDIISWAKIKKDIYTKKETNIFFKVIPIINIILILLAYVFFLIPKIVAIIFIGLQVIFKYLNSKNINNEFEDMFKYGDDIKTYVNMIERLESGKFKSKHIIDLKNSLKNKKGKNAITELKRLEKIVERSLNRKNFVFIPINILLLWDYQCLISLYKWKEESGEKIESWINVVGEIEELNSFAGLCFDNNDWTYPSIEKEESIFKVKDMAHPLLKKGVANGIDVEEPSRIILVTGSNMAGKSTFLRTVGINTVLGYCGSKVCAKNLNLSIMNLQTCMRISDDLDAGISSFYGELKRISNIVEESKKDLQVFFLLDEIFKGTNSYDRHIGAEMLLKQLYANNSMGLVSTHDLELGEMEKETMGNVLNYHFKEYYKEGKIYFDYKLRRGVSTTRNAIYLMKMAGVDIK